ncbi:MAG: cysteine desulfurase [Clostridia bacterium]|nr:cysteine desulfurase [Clostridia bacterium]
MIFLDNASTSQMSESVKNEYIKEAENFINPSASYSFALINKQKIENCKQRICKCLNVEYKENLIFTGSASEANNLAIFGSAKKGEEQYIFSSGEHLSVYNAAQELKNRGFNVQFCPLKPDGTMDLEVLNELLKSPTAFLSCIHVSNETGAINDIQKIGSMLKSKQKNAIFHVDGVQAFGKIDVNLSNGLVDLYTISAHKINGPKGIGALFVKNKAKLKPIIFGGGQEFGIRSGTENLPAIAGFALAAEEKMRALKTNFEYVLKLKNEFLKNIKREDIKLNSIETNSPYILSLSFVGVRGETLVRMCDDCGILIGTGSACSSKKGSLNRILQSMGKTKEENEGAIRISFSKDNTIEEIEKASKIILENFNNLKNMLS